MKKLLIATLLILSWTIKMDAQPTQFERCDHYLSEYRKYKGTKNYAKAADMLYYASNSITMVKQSLPFVFIRFAQLEYMDRYNVVFPDKNDEYWALYYILERFNEDDGSLFTHVVASTYASHILYVKTSLRYIKYLKPQAIPSILIKCMTMLDQCPEYSIETEYEKYYNLLQNKIVPGDKERMEALVKAEARKISGKYWTDSGIKGLIDRNSKDYINACLKFAKDSDKASAYALEGLITDMEGNKEEAIKLYEKSAKDNNVLGVILLVDHMSDTDKEISLLKNVENDEFFLRYGGALELAERFAKSEKLSDIQKAANLCQTNMGKSIFRGDKAEMTELYKQCQKKISIFQLQQQEEMLDPDDVLPSEYLALAQGYESIEGYEDKAMYFYRLAAEGGDLRSMCRVAIDDMYTGIVDGDFDKVKNAANLILDNQNSRFLPFGLNSAVIILYGLNGDEPNAEKAKIIYEKFAKKFEKSSNKKSYVEMDFISGGDYLPSTPKLNFYDLEKAMRLYEEGTAEEKAGKYDDADYSYSWSATWGHPFGSIKAEQMQKLSDDD